jgi:hypothetical protein
MFLAAHKEFLTRLFHRFEIEIILPPVNLWVHETIASFKVVCGRIIAGQHFRFRRMPKTGGARRSGSINRPGHLNRFGRFRAACLGAHRGAAEIARR